MGEQEEPITVELCEECGIVIGGELDMLTAPVVLEIVAELPANGQPINVDLSKVTFIDASGVRALLCLKHALPTARVVAVSPRVERVLTITETYEALAADGFSNTG